MKVKDLIKLLENVDPELIVRITAPDSEYPEIQYWKELKPYQVRPFTYKGKTNIKNPLTGEYIDIEEHYLDLG